MADVLDVLIVGGGATGYTAGLFAARDRCRAPLLAVCLERAGIPMSDAEWDAAEMGCGELVLELRARLAPLDPGQVLALTARDPGARADIPAWCRMTGHTLVSERHPRYLIRKEL